MDESTPTKRQSRARPSGEGKTPPRRESARKQKSTVELIRTGREQFETVTGTEIDTVTGFGKDGDGWELQVEVLELERIPDTTSLMATYRVRLEPDGDLAGYERVRRYARGQIDR